MLVNKLSVLKLISLKIKQNTDLKFVTTILDKWLVSGIMELILLMHLRLSNTYIYNPIC